ncbi:hypothetical protein ALC57_02796, partial [Trachymyrmex cornetzi]
FAHIPVYFSKSSNTYNFFQLQLLEVDLDRLDFIDHRRNSVDAFCLCNKIRWKNSHFSTNFSSPPSLVTRDFGVFR